jgi:hypothetical protein
MKGIPEKFKKEIETLMWDFIWEGSKISVFVSTFCTHCKIFVHAWIDF